MIKKALSAFKLHWPLVLVILVAAIIARQNINPNAWYSGWDNLHGEFDLQRYTNQVLGGAWLEHQGLGAPMNLAHLAEVSRLPILWLLSLVVPDHLIRITFIFLMYALGGVTMYFYLAKTWLDHRQTKLKNSLAALGGIVYLLHILTLQQFYIAFEMFTVQFAFLPLLFLIIHRFKRPLTAPTVLLFVGLQLLLAPSGHTPTNFYLAVLASQLYGFFLVLPKGWLKALKTAVVIGLLTFIINSYWIIPNLYYTIHNSHYVQESHDNQLFAPESVSSIREAGTWQNFLKGTQYLFEWKDYNFASGQLELIFNDWQTHLEKPLVSGLLMLIGVATVSGVIIVGFDRRKGSGRWAIILTYLTCVSFIWMGLFPTGVLFEKLYQSGAFTEAFRNPFTKLSIIYSVASVILFISTVEALANWLAKNKLRSVRPLGQWLLLGVLGGVIYAAWPSFQGHLISEKLKVQYPEQYQQLFAYLKTRDPQLRILPLPQLNHAGWEYYDWQFLGEGNGYQGMGFYFFGVPQPVLHRDSDRWVETSDFFFYELKYALDSQDLSLFEQVVAKYQVDLILIDETRADPSRLVDFPSQHQLARLAGFDKIWEQDFLSIYEKSDPGSGNKLLVPAQISFLETKANRVIYDAAYSKYGDYVLTTDNRSSVNFPLADLLGEELEVTYSAGKVTLTRTLPLSEGEYKELRIPGLVSDTTPVAITYQDEKLAIAFPKTELSIGSQTITLPHLPSQEFRLAGAPDSVLVLFDNQAVSVTRGQASQQVIKISRRQPLRIDFAPQPAVLPKTPEGEIDGSRLQIVELGWLEVEPSLWQEQTRVVEPTEHLQVTTYFPALALDLMANASQNCAQPLRGSITTHQSLADQSVVYTADKHGVNCNGLGLIQTSSWQDYLLRVVGNNQVGRGLKFFVSRNQGALPDDYMFATESFDSSVALHGLPEVDESALTLNWEARSFGQKAIAGLSQLSLVPMPLRQLAGAELKSVEAETVEVVTDNNLEVETYHLGTDTFHSLRVRCWSQPCVIGLDQSFDSGWLAFQVPGSAGAEGWWSLTRYQLLPHSYLNSWANAWQLPVGEYSIIIFYWPQALSGIQLLGLGMAVGVVLRWAIKFYRTKFRTLNKSLRRRLLGF